MASGNIAKRKIVRAAPIGDERLTRGSVSELHGMLAELEAIICGVTALVESDELNMSYVENPIGAAARLADGRSSVCTADLISPLTA